MERLTERNDERGIDADDRRKRSLVRLALRGMKGGLIATVVMTIQRLPVSRSLPPTAQFWAKFVGDGEPEDYPAQALALHLLYGAGAGAAFDVAFGRLERAMPRHREPLGVLLGAVYGLALSVFGTRVVLGRVLGMDTEPNEKLVFHVGHVVYGLTLGTWLGSRDPPGEADADAAE